MLFSIRCLYITGLYSRICGYSGQLLLSNTCLFSIWGPAHTPFILPSLLSALSLSSLAPLASFPAAPLFLSPPSLRPSGLARSPARPSVLPSARLRIRPSVRSNPPPENLFTNQYMRQYSIYYYTISNTRQYSHYVRIIRAQHDWWPQSMVGPVVLRPRPRQS